MKNLTFAEIVQVIDGEVLGGKDGLNKLLDKFVIGAMQLCMRYITPKSLLIVGDRIDVQRLALENGAAVLITGGFHTSDEVIALANELACPSCKLTYDTYTVATLINRALTDQLIKNYDGCFNLSPIFRNILIIGDADTVGDYKKLVPRLNIHFPVINEHRRLVGIVTVKDILDKPASMTLDKGDD